MLADDWYCKIDDEVHGPLSTLDLRRLAKEGTLVPEAEVRKGKTGKWLPARALKGVFPKRVPAEEAEKESSASYAIEEAPSCPSCSKALPRKAVLCVSCGYDLKAGRSLTTTYSGKSKTLRIYQGGKGFVLGFLVSLPFFWAGNLAEQPLLYIPCLLIIPFVLGTFTIVSMTRDKKNRPVCQLSKKVCFFRVAHRRAVLTEHDSLVIRYLEVNLEFLLFLYKPFIVGSCDSETQRKIAQRIEPSEDGRIELYVLKLKLVGRSDSIALCNADQATMFAIIDLIQGVVPLKIERD